MLSSTLRWSDVVISDYPPAHGITALREAVELNGAQLLFLPPYSPDVNPVENAL